MLNPVVARTIMSNWKSTASMAESSIAESKMGEREMR